MIDNSAPYKIVDTIETTIEDSYYRWPSVEDNTILHEQYPISAFYKKWHHEIQWFAHHDYPAEQPKLSDLCYSLGDDNYLKRQAELPVNQRHGAFDNDEHLELSPELIDFREKEHKQDLQDAINAAKGKAENNRGNLERWRKGLKILDITWMPPASDPGTAYYDGYPHGTEDEQNEQLENAKCLARWRSGQPNINQWWTPPTSDPKGYYWGFPPHPVVTQSK